MDKLYSLSAKSMKELLDKKEVSSVELTKSVIERIEKTDKDLTAYTSYNFENALKAALNIICLVTEPSPMFIEGLITHSFDSKFESSIFKQLVSMPLSPTFPTSH